jgi:hypothetical protein
MLMVVLAACTGHGGGQLPPKNPVFKGPASFGFSFSCEDKGGLNPPTGQLRIQLSYTDHGSNPIGSSFGIHGIVDQLDPVLESMICSGQEPPPTSEFGNELIFACPVGDVPDARDADLAVVPLRSHRAGQRPGLRAVAR